MALGLSGEGVEQKYDVMYFPRSAHRFQRIFQILVERIDEDASDLTDMHYYVQTASDLQHSHFIFDWSLFANSSAKHIPIINVIGTNAIGIQNNMIQKKIMKKEEQQVWHSSDGAERRSLSMTSSCTTITSTDSGMTTSVESLLSLSGPPSLNIAWDDNNHNLQGQDDSQCHVDGTESITDLIESAMEDCTADDGEDKLDVCSDITMSDVNLDVLQRALEEDSGDDA